VADRIHVARLGKRAAVLDPRKISMSDAVAVMTGAMPADSIPAECLADCKGHPCSRESSPSSRPNC
jgi:fructose transport system ATP-binding protein